MNGKHVMAIGLALALAGCEKKDAVPVKAAEAPAVRAELTRVTPRPFPVTVEITGTLVSLSNVEVKAETTGKVVRIAKREGDPVSAGEPVVWVDDSRYKLMVRQAETAVEVAAAALERTRVLEGHSKTEMERSRNLLKSGGITDRDLKSAEMAERDARAQTALAAAQLEQARAALATAKKALADCVVPAPVAGVVQRRYINEGAYVEPPTPVFSLVDNSRLELESLVPTSDLGSLRAGQRVTFTVNTFAEREFEGQVIDVNPAVQAETRSAKVRIRVNNAAGLLKAGMFAQGRILTGMQAAALLVPASSVYRDDQSAKSSHLFVVEQGKAARRAVRIGRETDGLLEITEGVQAGDLVVTNQSVEIAAGVRVEALERK